MDLMDTADTWGRKPAGGDEVDADRQARRAPSKSTPDLAQRAMPSAPSNSWVCNVWPVAAMAECSTMLHSAIRLYSPAIVKGSLRRASPALDRACGTLLFSPRTHSDFQQRRLSNLVAIDCWIVGLTMAFLRSGLDVPSRIFV